MKSKVISTFFFAIISLLTIITMVSIFSGIQGSYTPTTDICISCHNDTGYPNDTDANGLAAPYKRPHFDTVMCEFCHGQNPHTVVFIQPTGSYGPKSTAGSCPDCHMTGIPSENNSNFTSAFKIPNPLRHSSNALNGSVWGNYWTNSSPKEACIYCHNKTLHSIAPIGRILEWSLNYHTNGSIGNNYSCSGCHYKGDANWSTMIASFAAAGLESPPEITNGTNWRGKSADYLNHSLNNYFDNTCKECHGISLAANAGMSEFIHNVSVADLNACMSCHPTVTAIDLGKHSTLNGSSAVDNGDCKTCHYRTFPMVKGAVNNSNTYFCADCHTSAGTGPNKSSIIFTDRKHGEVSCMDCHAADGRYHQDDPRGAIANQTYVNRYLPGNTTVTDCADCHYASNLDDAPFNAPGAGTHSKNACSDGGCHNAGTITMVQTVHHIDPQVSGWIPTITAPTLSASSVPQGMNVTVNATVTVNSFYNFVDGAQYRIMSGGTPILPWTPMSPVNSSFDRATEDVTATISTNIPVGTYTVEVRGMGGGPAQNTTIRYYPMNGDISATQSTTFTVQPPKGYINGTVTSGGSALTGATVFTIGASTTSDVDGTYSLNVPAGTYDVTASKQPTHSDNTTTGVVVTQSNTTILYIVIEQKPTGTLSGIVTTN